MPPKSRSKKAATPKVAAAPASEPQESLVATAAISPVSAAGTPLSRLISRALSDPVAAVRELLCDRQYFWLLAGLLAAFNLVLGVLIINKVSCKPPR